MKREEIQIPDGGEPKPFFYVTLENAQDGIVDVTGNYAHVNTGINSLKIETVGGICGSSLIQSGGSLVKPRWIINRPLKFTFSCLCYLRGAHGHGWCWEYRNQADTNWLVGGATSHGGNARKVSFSATGSNNSFFTPPSTNVWYHFAMTISGGVCKQFMNGALVKTTNMNNGINDTTIFSDFSFRYQSSDNYNNSSSVFRNVKLFEPLDDSIISQLYEIEKLW